MFYPASAGQTTPYPSNSLHIKSSWKEERDYGLVYKHKVRQAESIESIIDPDLGMYPFSGRTRKQERTRMSCGNVRKDEKGQYGVLRTPYIYHTNTKYKSKIPRVRSIRDGTPFI